MKHIRRSRAQVSHARAQPIEPERVQQTGGRMKSWSRYVVAIIAFIAASAIPIRAQEKQIHYAVRNLGTLGGVLGSSAHSINDIGWVAGDANLTGDTVEHAALWRDGVVTDLGTLGGSNSGVGFPVKNDDGLLVGLGQTSTIDPLGETFCTFACNGSGTVTCEGSNHSCRAFRWRNGHMEPLGTLGGNNSGALGANNRGLVVGTAENNTHDPDCLPPQVLDYKAVTWLAGTIHELPALPGDPIAAAAGVNDNDQVVGGSGNCGSGPGISAIFVHAVLWQNDSVTDLGNLGGVLNNVAYAINNSGQVVGSSDLPGDNVPGATPVTHAFFWQDGVMIDLGTLPGDFWSAAFGINE